MSRLEALASESATPQMSRLEALASAVVVFLVALATRLWAASQITFPRPEDVAYYVGVARNLVEGRGLVSDAIWSFNTPPLSFPRPAFEVWLPLPSFLAAAPMAIAGPSFAAAQLSSILVGAIVCVLAWRLAADVAEARSMPAGRARALALGAGFTTAVYLPLVLASVQPDSTMPFAALVLAACLVMTRLERSTEASTLDLLALGVLLGLAALTRNEAIWLALVWGIVAWRVAGRQAGGGFEGENRLLPWLGLVGLPAVVALIVFAPWAIRDWLTFGTPLPGQALANALFLDGRDVFAWQRQPTLDRYLAAGPATLLGLRLDGTVHNLVNVLLLLGVPVSVVGLLGLPGAWRAAAPADGVTGARRAVAPANGVTGARRSIAPARAATGEAASSPPNPLRPLLLFSVITFVVASLVFPVSTTWGTFLHASGAIHVLLVISALLGLDWLIGWVGARRGWTRPVAWLGATFAVAGCVLFSGVLLRSDGEASRDAAAHFGALAAALRDPSFAMPIDAEPGPILTDTPIWLAESTRHTAIALPNEQPSSILNLARSFDPPARLMVVGAENTGVWPALIIAGSTGSECFEQLPLPVEGTLAYRITCP